jgi:hypothetical protein
MLSLEQDPPINPGVAPSPEGVTTVIADPAPVRRTVRLDLPADDQPPAELRVLFWRRARRPRLSPVVLAERLVGDWAPTLWQSVLLAGLLVGVLFGVALAFGIAGVVAGLGLCALVRLVPVLRRRH